MADEHRALRQLHELTRDYPHMNKDLNTFMRGRGKDLPFWPDWCFLPMGGWHAMLRQGDPFLAGMEVSRLAAIGTWRYSQGIYRYDPDLLRALLDTPLTGDLPCDVLFHLPEWALYVEVPGGTEMFPELCGFWVHLEHDVNHDRAELRLLLDMEVGSVPLKHSNLIPVPIHLGAWPLREAVRRMTEHAREQYRKHEGVYRGDFNLNDTRLMADDVVDQMTRGHEPLVSLLLYLCSQKPEIDGNREPGWSPYRAEPRRVKGGWKLFPATKPRIFDVGKEIGARLREGRREPSEATGRTVRAHLRRGHWHGFWTGPRTTKQTFVLRWLPPQIVAAGGVA